MKLARFNDLLASPAVERWVRKKADRTRYTYLNRLEALLPQIEKDTGAKTPDEFVIWAKARDGVDVQDTIEKIAETRPDSTPSELIFTMRSLLRKQGYNQLPKMERTRTLQEFHPGYKRKEILSLLGYLDKPIQKLYVYVAKDSGLRSQDLLSLRYRHVRKGLEAGDEFIHLELEPLYYNRQKAAGITFIGPDSVRLLKQLVNNRTVSSDPDARIFPFGYNAILKVLLLAMKKAGLDPKIQPSHGLRKFFDQSLDRVGMDVHKKLQLEGHSQGVRVHYTSQNLEELRELYKQTYRFLDLTEEAAADNRVSDLEKTVKEQRTYIDALKGELDRIRSIEEELAAIRKRLPKADKE